MVSLALLLGACDNSDDPGVDDTLKVPTTYVFERDGQTTVNYEGQTQRLNMLEEMGAYMAETRSLGTTVDANTLKAMYANENSPFSATYTKNLKSKTFQADVAFFESWMERMATHSQLNQNAAPGQAGVLNEEYPQAGSSQSAGYLVDENGIEHHQIIEKGLMGAVFYYQAMEVYLSQDRMGQLGNDDLSEGQAYTNMEHYFDEAFGYFGVPVDFPVSQQGVRFWGKYCNNRNNDQEGRFGFQGINEEIMEAFRKGRAAIVQKEYEARDEAILKVQNLWERVIGGTAANYLERSLSSDNPPTYRKHHYLSEAIAFMLSLKYKFDGGNSKNPRYSNAQLVEEALAIIGPETNLWDVTDADINAAISKLQEAFPQGELQ